MAMASKSSKLLIAAVLVAVLALVGWRWLRPASGPGDAATLPPDARGGELVASIRSEPSTYNRYSPAGASAATDFLALLTHARLVRVNRASDEVEPWLAESWTESDDGLTRTLRLRQGCGFRMGRR
jgi:peptide/nickel transport system substrate-binding protein